MGVVLDLAIMTALPNTLLTHHVLLGLIGDRVLTGIGISEFDLTRATIIDAGLKRDACYC